DKLLVICHCEWNEVKRSNHNVWSDCFTPFAIDNCLTGRDMRELGVKNSLPMPNAQCPMPNSQFPIPNAQCPMPNSQFPIPNSQFPMPNAQCPIPNAQCPMPNAQFPIPNN
ncbi:hypothetical protein, partial [Nostoc sp. CHAB 5715]|uniref:hypothetical protein n=1 Tax=Nostoc sp. CHAB 5715 TaxID=2780400 RepID=UPI001E408BCE